MDNNENNVQNQVNEKVNTPQKKSGKKVTIILGIIVFILVLAAGVLAGVMISGNGNKIIKQVEDKIVNNKEEKKIETNEEEVYASVINDYKNAINEYDEEDYDILEKIESKYPNVNPTIVFMSNRTSRNMEQDAKVQYAYYDIDKNGISELIVGIGYNNGNSFYEGAIYSYNKDSNSVEKVFYQDTMERGSLSVYDNGIIFSEGSGGAALHYYEFGKISQDGHSYELIESIEEEYIQENSNPVYKNYETNQKLNYNSLDEIKAKYLNNSNAVKYSNFKKIEISDKKSSDNAVDKVSYFEQNKNLNYSSNPKDNINGKVAIIKMGEKIFQTTIHDGYYTYTDNFGNSYNIKEITNITSEYRMTSNNDTTNLFRAVIEYIDNNNAKKSFDTAVFVPNDANNYSTLSINGPYENYTGSTSFVKNFTDLYADGSDTSVFSSFANLNYQKYNFKINNQEGIYSFTVNFDNTGKPTLNAISVSDVHHEAIFVTKNITNIKQDVAAGTSYVTFDFTAWTAGGDTTGTVEMKFSNVSSNETIGIKVKFNDMLSNFDNNGDYIELNKISKVVKKLNPSGWAGSSMQEIRLCEDGNVYHVTYNGEGTNTESNIVSNELIATNADTIEEKINDQVFEAIIVKGKDLNVIKNNESWILFENN